MAWIATGTAVAATSTTSIITVASQTPQKRPISAVDPANFRRLRISSSSSNIRPWRRSRGPSQVADLRPPARGSSGLPPEGKGGARPSWICWRRRRLGCRRAQWRESSGRPASGSSIKRKEKPVQGKKF
ncbi:hypothetical protein QJS10_CPA03g00572 [Acorus calamus]|uniref:Uncharacterized protein n=1 Tax=Acorus calamus TaxID=4465 RepID=A0AAV9F9V4_ACOCL|nr:hypothetical protein QJS10_CPA03g00572 [Acorus calamus]